MAFQWFKVNRHKAPEWFLIITTCSIWICSNSTLVYRTSRFRCAACSWGHSYLSAHSDCAWVYQTVQSSWASGTALSCFASRADQVCMFTEMQFIISISKKSLVSPVTQLNHEDDSFNYQIIVPITLPWIKIK